MWSYLGAKMKNIMGNQEQRLGVRDMTATLFCDAFGRLA